MAKLRSPFIVQFFGYCISPHKCLVMEYMPKGSLYAVLHSNQVLNWTIRIKVAFEISAGLSFLHQEKILHRDIKSLNVLLNQEWGAKLSDFGLSKVKNESQSTSTVKSSVGTVAWMAPELSFTDDGCTPASDIYSLGVTLWELAAREIPFKKVAKPALIPMRAQAGYRDDIPSDCPAKLNSLIQACWATEPSQRPDAEQVATFMKSEQTDFNTFKKSFLPSYSSYQNNVNSNSNNNSGYQNNINSSESGYQNNVNSPPSQNLGFK